VHALVAAPAEVPLADLSFVANTFLETLQKAVWRVAGKL
jgi:hypothetical protein